MADLNIRNFPDDVMAHIKAEAASMRLTLREYCIGKLDTGASVNGKPADSKPATVGSTPTALASKEYLKSCTSCGALNGMHQRGCKA